MIDVEVLVDLIKSYNPASNITQIRKAYAFGKKAHEGQFRQSGEPYFSHPVEVAFLLGQQRLDDASIITALLHDTVEDTSATFNEIGELFGYEIAELVDGVTKLTNIEFVSTEAKQAENIRKLLLAMSKDLRVIFVKLADRLHNIRTIKSLPPEKQLRKARETMDIYAPLAGRLGMQSIREELEDLSFEVMNPEARTSIMRRFIKLRQESGDVISVITEDIRLLLTSNDIAGVVSGREKKPYSIWRKMEEKQLSFSRLSDVYGFRVITDSEDDVYRVLGLIHRRWNAVPGRFKDYISQPKQNGYRSIHTTVSGRDAMRVEVQIRTRQMHEVAEVGVAAHWAYKDGFRVKNPFAVDPVTWVRNLSQHYENTLDSESFLEHVKLEMMQDKVYCFTPKGDVIPLPRKATPLDFAYAIHTRVGHKAVGAKVDGHRVPLYTSLRNGQSVEIITAAGQSPVESWEQMVVTGRAKSAIRRALREERRDAYIQLGQEIARVALAQVGKKATDRALETAAEKLGYQDGDTLLEHLGAAELKGRELVEVLYPELLDDENLPQIDTTQQPLIIGLTSSAEYQVAKCCNPLPGERIVGIALEGVGVVVHAIDCPTLERHEEKSDDWIDLSWNDERHIAEHLAMIEVTMANSAGVLGRICTLIGEQNCNISDMRFSQKLPDFYKIYFEVEVRDLKHMLRILTAIEADSDVATVTRLKKRS